MSGLLLPRERSKTLTALVGAEPLVQAQAADVQRLTLPPKNVSLAEWFYRDFPCSQAALVFFFGEITADVDR